MKSLLVLLVLLTSACASMSSPSHPLPRAVTLEFTGTSGANSETRYFSNSRTLTYEENQIIRDHLEGVDFSVADHTYSYDPQTKILKFELRTIRKDGTVDLHELAFPELNEQITYVQRSNGEVLLAGRYPPQSLFFVPSLPIPNGPVEMGDAWTMDHTWLSAKDSLPLRLEVVAILKDIVSCEKTKVCAVLEISGHVNVVARTTTVGAHFDSRMSGRLLFSLDRGDVLWSLMRSEEQMGAKRDKVVVNSCMVSEMKSQPNYQIAFACDPNQKDFEIPGVLLK